MTTHLVAVFSDVHLPHEDPRAFASFRSWHSEHKPELTVALGDIIDLAQISRYDPEADGNPYAAAEIAYAVETLNDMLSSTGRIVMLPGNHEDRWAKAVFGTKALALKGTKGLTLREQFYAHGLDKRIQWVDESVTCVGLFIGKRAVLVRHGHRQAGRFGVKNVSTALVSKFPNISTVVGHHHRAQLACRTSLGETVMGIANPHLSGDHAYAGASPDWQRGFTVLEFYGAKRLRDCTKFTPHLVIMADDGSFCYNGKVY